MNITVNEGEIVHRIMVTLNEVEKLGVLNIRLESNKPSSFECFILEC